MLSCCPVISAIFIMSLVHQKYSRIHTHQSFSFPARPAVALIYSFWWGRQLKTKDAQIYLPDISIGWFSACWLLSARHANRRTSIAGSGQYLSGVSSLCCVDFETDNICLDLILLATKWFFGPRKHWSWQWFNKLKRLFNFAYTKDLLILYLLIHFFNEGLTYLKMVVSMALKGKWITKTISICYKPNYHLQHWHQYQPRGLHLVHPSLQPALTVGTAT